MPFGIGELVVTANVWRMTNTLKPSIAPETVLFVTSTTPAATCAYRPLTSLWSRSSSSDTPWGTLAGSYPIVSVTGSSKTMPSGPKSNAVPGIGTGPAGRPVAGSAVMMTAAFTAPTGKTRFTAPPAREISAPAGSATCSTVTEAVPVAAPEVAVIVAVPSPTAVTSPVGKTLATDNEVDSQATDAPLIEAPF